MESTLFWKNITALCSEYGIAPSVLATELKLSPSTAARWKSGAIPKQSTLKIIAQKFNVTPVSLTTYNYTEKANGEEGSVKKSVKIPVLGRVAAGIPIEQIVDVEDYEEIPAAMAANGEYFALKIHGTSMQPRMCEGDIIIVRKQENVESGETAVISINGQDATVKKVRKMQDGIMLISTNPEYEPMYYTNKQVADLPIRILGKVVEIRIKL